MTRYLSVQERPVDSLYEFLRTNPLSTATYTTASWGFIVVYQPLSVAYSLA